ncbi:Aminotransferase-like plant mobile domain-containing protein [Dioscorea alata]|uniref:Aminotransferase-like plant mobile domain-containing protein n=1 Tax=Dioscorea alata TaxID=55571 RepID=A0ACB7WDA3_DIOAL|nr:Aminotransferase-like plant mobile domain-containing protein [Dioscorea alata]
MAHSTKGKLVEPLHKLFDDRDKAPDGISISRYYPIDSKSSGKPIQYLGSDFSKWTNILAVFREIGELTPTYFHKGRAKQIILMNPYESTSSDLNLDTLGHRVITDPIASIWDGKTPFHYYTPYPPKYEKWASKVIKRSSETLKRAGIMGFDPSIAKTITETWCSKTNTFATPFGELGISLWDLRCIRGFPIIGKFYEEYVPPNHMLYSKEVYPSILKDLFNIYQWIGDSTATKTGKVTYVQWADFFCKTPLGKRRFGDDSAHPISQASEECRLAAFLCLWLCHFVMPCRSSFICPEVFVMAAKLAKGTKLSLASVVLACICTNLDIITSQHKGSQNISIPFPCYYFYEIPSMAYISRVGAGTYTPRMARGIPFSCDEFKSVGWYKDYKEPNDNKMLNTIQSKYFMALRQSILPLHFNNDVFAQQYNPHRVAWQFGYVQGFPKDIQVSKHPQDTGLLVGYWYHFARRKYESKFYIPSHESTGHPLYLYAIYDNHNEQDNPPQRKRDVSSLTESRHSSKRTRTDGVPIHHRFSILSSHRASSSKAIPSYHDSLYSIFEHDDDNYTPFLDVDPPVESPQVEVVPFTQTIPKDSTPKATLTDDNSPSKGSFKHGEHCATRTTSMNQSHLQSSDKNHVLQAVWVNNFIDKVKSSQPHECEPLREEIIKLHKTMMLLGINIFATRDKVFEVLDIAKRVQDMKDKEENPHMEKKKKLMASARCIEEKKSTIMVTTQSINEAKMRLTQTRRKLQGLEAQRKKLKAQEEEDIYLINSSLDLLKSIASIEEVDKSLAIVLEKLEALGGGDDSHLSSSLEELLANFERLKSQL